MRATEIEGLVVLDTKTIPDDRGAVRELFRWSAFEEAGLPVGPWRQINVTESVPGALRGLHGERMTKVVGVVSGEALGAYVDVRAGSPTLGRVVTVGLRAGVQVLIPPGICNGFQTTGTERSQYVYCFDDEWRPAMPGVHVNALDPDLGIDWPLPPLLSPKDAALPSLAEVLAVTPPP